MGRVLKQHTVALLSRDMRAEWWVGGWDGILLARIASRGCLRHTPLVIQNHQGGVAEARKERLRTLVVGKIFFLTFWVSFATLLDGVVRDTTEGGVNDKAVSFMTHAGRRHEHPSHFKTGDSPTEEWPELVGLCHFTVRHREPYPLSAYERNRPRGGWWFWRCDLCTSA